MSGLPGSNNFEEAKLVEEKIKKLEEYYNREKNNYDELALQNREINSVENLKRNTLSELERIYEMCLYRILIYKN